MLQLLLIYALPILIVIVLLAIIVSRIPSLRGKGASRNGSVPPYIPPETLINASQSTQHHHHHTPPQHHHVTPPTIHHSPPPPPMHH